MKLLSTSIPNYTLGIDVEHLLDIWENDGLDAAVKAWKDLSEENKVRNRNAKKSNSVSILNTSEKDSLKSMGITKESWTKLRQEIDADGGIPVDFDIDWDNFLV